MRETVRPEKVTRQSEVREALESSPAFILTGYSGLTVAQLTTLRGLLKKEGAQCRVFKNTQTRRVLADIGFAAMAEALEGPTAIIISGADPVAPAKILVKFNKDIEKLVIKSGVVEKKEVDEKQIRQLAKLPSREQLIAKVVGGIKSPLYGLVNVLSGPTRKLVYAVEAIRKQKEVK